MQRNSFLERQFYSIVLEIFNLKHKFNQVLPFFWPLLCSLYIHQDIEASDDNTSVTGFG